MVRERESDKKCGEYKIESKSWDLIKTILAKKMVKMGNIIIFYAYPIVMPAPKWGNIRIF